MIDIACSAHISIQFELVRAKFLQFLPILFKVLLYFFVQILANFWSLNLAYFLLNVTLLLRCQVADSRLIHFILLFCFFHFLLAVCFKLVPKLFIIVRYADWISFWNARVLLNLQLIEFLKQVVCKLLDPLVDVNVASLLCVAFAIKLFYLYRSLEWVHLLAWCNNYYLVSSIFTWAEPWTFFDIIIWICIVSFWCSTKRWSNSIEFKRWLHYIFEVRVEGQSRCTIVVLLFAFSGIILDLRDGKHRMLNVFWRRMLFKIIRILYMNDF